MWPWSCMGVRFTGGCVRRTPERLPLQSEVARFEITENLCNVAVCDFASTVTQAVCKKAHRRSLVAGLQSASRQHECACSAIESTCRKARQAGQPVLSRVPFDSSHHISPVRKRSTRCTLSRSCPRLSPYLYPQPILGPRSAACPAQPCLLLHS
jgi:hypothetical protein